MTLSALDELYHANTKQCPVRLGFTGARERGRRERQIHARYEAQKDRFKTYPAAPIIALPAANASRMTLDDAIVQRRSCRRFASRPLSLEVLATLLARSYGTCGERGGTLVRPVPSGGGLYPLDLYVLQHTSNDAFGAGVYHYHPGGHHLERVRDRCARAAVEATSLYPEIFAGTASMLAIVADMPRTRAKYGERAYRLALLEAGHVSQMLYLLAPALGIGIVALDGFYDDRVHELLDVDGVGEIVLVCFAVGVPA